MSLFATDAALLTDAPRPTTPSARPRADEPKPTMNAQVPDVACDEPSPPSLREHWSRMLPALIESALSHGLVRTAAMLHEASLEHAGITSDAIDTSRQRIDACAALDAALQQRQLHGELAFVPSLSSSRSGTPRFVTGVRWEELSHPAVAAYMVGELGDGAQAELRNFLEETLRDGALLLDLEPGVGTAVLTALSWAGGTVHARAWQSDAMLHALISRNTAHAGLAGRLDLQASVASPADLQTRTTPSQTIIHLGSHSAAPFTSLLKSWASRATAVVWQTGAAQDQTQASALTSLGFTLFVLAEREGEMLLVPYAADASATTAFALSHAYVAALEHTA